VGELSGEELGGELSAAEEAGGELSGGEDGGGELPGGELGGALLSGGWPTMRESLAARASGIKMFEARCEPLRTPRRGRPGAPSV
jgi:hypothetical protein